MTRADNKPSETNYRRDDKKGIYLRGNAAVPIRDSYFV